MSWEKGGLIFAPSGEDDWALTNASFPTIEVLNEATLRIYFTALDRGKRGRIGFVDVDARDPRIIRHVRRAPVLSPGPAGAFDTQGVNVFSVVRTGDERRLYYQGWHPRPDAPYGIRTGLAIGRVTDDALQKQASPILDYRDDDRFMRAAPFVMRDGEVYKMWYASCREWVTRGGKTDYRVHLAYLESENGIDWPGAPRIVLAPTGDDYAVGRPSVLKLDGLYHLWYSVRSFAEPYRLAYAVSTDGLAWRARELNLGRSAAGWDAEMTCYPQVIRQQGRLLMVYNGNGHGRSGFGFATASL